MVVVPKPDKIVTYAISSSESLPSSSSSNAGALYLYGDPSSSKMALLCAGFPDDHTVFQPFAKALSIGGGAKAKDKDNGDGIFVGVMCLPGFDDRPKDNVPWTKHKPDGYTFDEMTYAVREAAKTLRKESTNNKKNDDDDTNDSDIYNNHTPLTGIFHDWGVIPGTMWVNRLEKEAGDVLSNSENTTGSDNCNKIWKPDRIVFFDVLAHHSSISTHTDSIFNGLTRKEIFVTSYYKVVLAISFLLQRYVSKYLAAVCVVSNHLIMQIFHLGPCYEFDTSKALYENNDDGNVNDKNNRSLFRLIYTAYPYWILLRNMLLKVPNLQLHSDLKATPILYLYGPKKRTQFHSFGSLELLKREEKENRSLSRVAALEGTGHWFYIQRQDECLEHVLDFMNAENTFVAT